jgi:hypothetical protein
MVRGDEGVGEVAEGAADEHTGGHGDNEGDGVHGMSGLGLGFGLVGSGAGDGGLGGLACG